MGKKIQPVMVEWVDSVAANGWRDFDGADMRCTTVGIHHNETKETVTIAQNQSAYMRGEYITIPKVAIKKVTKLGKKGGAKG